MLHLVKIVIQRLFKIKKRLKLEKSTCDKFLF